MYFGDFFQKVLTFKVVKLCQGQKTRDFSRVEQELNSKWVYSIYEILSRVKSTRCSGKLVLVARVPIVLFHVSGFSAEVLLGFHST